MLSKSYTNLPKNTLMVVLDDEETKDASTLDPDKKILKSVHFANEEASFKSSTSEDRYTESFDGTSLMQTDNQYSGDTFTSDSSTRTKASGTSHESSILVLESSEETRTASDISYTDSFASTDLNSASSFGDWDDLTEIVKDIEELEESGNLSLLGSEIDDQEDETETEELSENAKQDFLLKMIQNLQSKKKKVGPSVETSIDDTETDAYDRPIRDRKKEDFYRHLIKRCTKNVTRNKILDLDQKQGSKYPMYSRNKERDKMMLENWGLSSALLERLRLQNFQDRLSKKSHDLDKEIEASDQFIKTHKRVEEDLAEAQFLSEMCRHVEKFNSYDKIQEHLIKMHPVKCFAEFLCDLPSIAYKDSRDILYKYRSLVLSRMSEDVPETQELDQ